MEEIMNTLNWPTAFVIVSIIFAGAFIYNKPTGATFGLKETSPGGAFKELTKISTGKLWHTRVGKVRLCEIKNSTRLKVHCGNWAG